MSEIKLSDKQRLVLRALAGVSEPGWCLPFAAIMERTGLPRSDVRMACRWMKRRGLAEFHIGLWTEDGEPAGSGYAASPAGRALVGDDAIRPEYVD